MSNKRSQSLKSAAEQMLHAKIDNDCMMNRLMLAFVVVVCGITVVMCLKNANSTDTMYSVVAPVMRIVGILLFVASLICFFVLRKKLGNEKILTGWNILGIGIVCLLCAIMYFVNPSAASVLSVVLMLVAMILYFIWYIYPMPFFLMSIFAAVEGSSLYFAFAVATVRTLSRLVQWGFRICALVLPIAFVVIHLLIERRKDKKRNISSPVPLVGVIVLAAAAFVGSMLLLLASVFYVPYVYVLMVFFAVYLVVGIVCTVRIL